MISIPNDTLVRSEGDKVALMGNIYEAAVRYTWRVPDAPKGYYSVWPGHLMDADSPLALLKAAREYGYVHSYPHIADVLSEYPVTPLAEAKTDDLRAIARMMAPWAAEHGLTIVSVREEFPDRLDIGLPVSARLVGQGWVAVHTYALQQVLASLPVGQATVGTIAHADYKALCIQVDGDPSASYYLPTYGQGLTAFVPR